MLTGADNGQSVYFIDYHAVLSQAVDETGKGTFDRFDRQAGTRRDISNKALSSPGAVEVFGKKPVSAFHETDAVARIDVK